MNSDDEDKRVRAGDRFVARRDIPTTVLTVWAAPGHTGGAEGMLRAGTVLVALDQVPGAENFGCYPEEYDSVEQSLVPEEVREDPSYYAYYLTFPVRDIDALFETLRPVEGPPRNRLPRG